MLPRIYNNFYLVIFFEWDNSFKLLPTLFYLDLPCGKDKVRWKKTAQRKMIYPQLIKNLWCGRGCACVYILYMRIYPYEREIAPIKRKCVARGVVACPRVFLPFK